MGISVGQTHFKLSCVGGVFLEVKDLVLLGLDLGEEEDVDLGVVDVVVLLVPPLGLRDHELDERVGALGLGLSRLKRD